MVSDADVPAISPDELEQLVGTPNVPPEGYFKTTGSKNTRLDVSQRFSVCDFRRDHLAHVSRYLFFCEKGILHLKRKLGRPIRVVEIGIGDMHVARTFYTTYVTRKKEYVQEWYGADIDAAIIEHSKKAYPSMIETMGMKLEAIDATRAKLPYEDGYFDMAIFSEVIEHVPKEQSQKILDELARVTSPDGLLFVSTPNHDGSNAKLPADHVYEYGYQELQDKFSEAGLEVVEHFGTFMQLTRLPKDKPTVTALYKFFQRVFDKHMLSIVMAKFVPEQANNCTWVLCKART